MSDISLSDIFKDDDTPAPAYREMSGLKLSGSHKQTMTLGGKDVEVPTFRYVEALEKQVRELRQELREAQKTLLRMTQTVRTLQERSNENSR